MQLKNLDQNWPIPATVVANLCGFGREGNRRCRYLTWPDEKTFECVKMVAASKRLIDQQVSKGLAAATADNCSGPPDFIRLVRGN